MEKELDALPDRVCERIINAIAALARLPVPRGAVKLRGRDEYRIRVGDYRVLYIVDIPAKTIEIVAVAHRKEAYR
ncbi:MAG: type II toxin-antitoxin system RelE/ParE family toxin [Nitrospinae bacterium]|nr:type II toxin-antitoxin system RelE/ParE family toxin [Nitrospinota bacterium]